MAELDHEVVKQIAPGMRVEATDADLGTADLSKPEVARVEADPEGRVISVVVRKGTVFKKEIRVPAERVASVATAAPDALEPGTVHIAADSNEIAGLAPAGAESLPERAGGPDAGAEDVLARTEEALPTDAGLRRLEAGQASPPATGGLRVLGPGFLAGMAGNDSSAVTTYAADGAQAGYGHLWLLLLATPLLYAVQYTCAKIGRLTGRGLANLLREHYGLHAAVPAAGLLVLANAALIAADLVAIATGLELLTGLPWGWFLLPVAAILWYITVYQNYDSIKRVFLILSLACATYLVTAVLAHPDWGTVLQATIVPHLDFSLAAISAAVALLGATISPYQMFWQVQGETEEPRPGRLRQQVRHAALDVASGVISGNLVAYAVVVSTATAFAGHARAIHTALDAAQGLDPLLGPAAKYLFATGLIGAGLVGIPVLLASTSYAVADTVGWPAGLSKHPWQSEGFYLILSVVLAASVGVAVLGLDPIQLMVWANVLQSVLAPALVVVLLLVGNNRRIMRGSRLGLHINGALGLLALLMIAAVAVLFYGLVAGPPG